MSKLKIKVASVSTTAITLNHVDIPRQLWEVFEQWSEHRRISTLQGMWIFFQNVLDAMKRRDPMYAEITAVCRDTLRYEERPADDSDRSGPEPVKLASLPPIDGFFDYLEMNDKTSSGFVGVYPNGKAFRAMGCRPDGGGGGNACTLGSYPTPDLAALARLVYYRRHKLLYGRWVNEIHKMMRTMMESRDDVTVDDALDSLNSIRQAMGKMPIEITEDRCLYIGRCPPPIDDADGASS